MNRNIRSVPDINITQRQYLVSNFDEQGENNDDKQVVKNADSSDDDVDDLQCKNTNVSEVLRLRGGRSDVVPRIVRQRCVVHRCRWAS